MKTILLLLISLIIFSCKVKNDNNYFYHNTNRPKNDKCQTYFIRVKDKEIHYYSISDCDTYYIQDDESDTIDVSLLKEIINCGSHITAIYFLRKKNNKIQITHKNQYNNKKTWTDLYSLQVNDTIDGLTLWSSHPSAQVTISEKRIFLKDTLLTIPDYFNNVDCYLFKEIVSFKPEKYSYWRYSFVDKKTLLPIYIETYLYDKNVKEYLVKIW